MFEHDYKAFPELTNAQLADFGFSSPHPQFTEDFDAVVVKVHDGDTLSLTTPERDFIFPLRLLDIDAPELSEGGEEARDWLKNLVLNETIRVQIDPDNRVGKYGRLLGKVIYGGMDVGEEMLHLTLVSKFGFKKEGQIESISKILLEASI